MLRPSRKPRGPDATLPVRIASFVLGAAAGLTGMATQRMWLVTAGTVFLAIGLAFAIAGEARRRRDASAARGDDSTADE